MAVIDRLWRLTHKKKNHCFNFDKVEVLGVESRKFGRCFLEMLHIHYNGSDAINRMEDTNFLKRDYKVAIDSLRMNRSLPIS